MSRNLLAMLVAASVGLGFSAQAMAENGRQNRHDGWRDRGHNERSNHSGDRPDHRHHHHGWSQGQHNGWRDRNHDGRVDWRDQPGHVQPRYDARDRNRDGRVDWRDWH